MTERPFGGYLYSPVRDSDGVLTWEPDTTRPFFPLHPEPAPAPPERVTEPQEPAKPARAAGVGAWYVSKRTDRERGAAPPFDLLQEPERFAWFGQLAENEDACARAWAGVVRWVAQTFDGCHALRKPWETGLTLIEHMLPWPLNRSTPYRYLTLSDELRRLIVSTTTQHRMELLTDPGREMRRYVVYDARVAYASHLRHLPVILAGDDGAPSVVHDTLTTFERYRPGRYLCDVTVPRDWSHIGLAPRKLGDGSRWEWPATPGESWTTWLDECELRLLDQRGWPYAIRQRLLFASPKTPGSDPLREFAERVSAELERIERYAPTPAIRAYRAAIRALTLHPIGAWHKGAANDRRHVDDLDELTPEDAAADIEPAEGGGWIVSNSRDLTPFRSRWWRPEMSSAVYAHERVEATRRALELPRTCLLALRGDALHLADFDPGWQDTGKVGSYRKQVDRSWTQRRRAPDTRDAMAELRKEVGA